MKTFQQFLEMMTDAEQNYVNAVVGNAKLIKSISSAMTTAQIVDKNNFFKITQAGNNFLNAAINQFSNLSDQLKHVTANRAYYAAIDLNKILIDIKGNAQKYQSISGVKTQNYNGAYNFSDATPGNEKNNDLIDFSNEIMTIIQKLQKIVV